MTRDDTAMATIDSTTHTKTNRQHHLLPVVLSLLFCLIDLDDDDDGGKWLSQLEEAEIGWWWW